MRFWWKIIPRKRFSPDLAHCANELGVAVCPPRRGRLLLQSECLQAAAGEAKIRALFHMRINQARGRGDEQHRAATQFAVGAFFACDFSVRHLKLRWSNIWLKSPAGGGLGGASRGPENTHAERTLGPKYSHGSRVYCRFQYYNLTAS